MLKRTAKTIGFALAIHVAASHHAASALGREASVSFNPSAVQWPVWSLSFGITAVFWALYASRRNRERVSLELQRLRSRIAADLHDDVGASLSQVAIMSEVASQATTSQSAALKEIASVSRAVLDSLADTVWALDPSHDRLGDLTERMRWFAGETLSARGISMDFRVLEPAAGNRLGADVRRQVFLIFKECMNNIAKHAGAAHATIVLGGEQDGLLLHVEDDGHGFQPEETTRGHGLGNMNRRARLLGGALETHSQPGRGTSLDLRVPVSSGRRQWRRLWRMLHEYAANRRVEIPNMALKAWRHQQ
jgi:signal transduction histidine kinase